MLGSVRFVKNILLNVDYDKDIGIQVPFGVGECHKVQRIETDGSDYFTIVFPDGSIIKGVSKEVFEFNKQTPVVQVDFMIEPTDMVEIEDNAPPIEVALFDGTILGEKP